MPLESQFHSTRICRCFYIACCVHKMRSLLSLAVPLVYITIVNQDWLFATFGRYFIDIVESNF